MELSARQERLEKELGLKLQPMETDLDLQSMQIDQDEPLESYVHADLDFVRASIFEGKPDKESVRQWLQKERQDNPGLSYATLAETLNLAGIPTLSGRDTWNRGTLRNLLTERLREQGTSTADGGLPNELSIGGQDLILTCH